MALVRVISAKHLGRSPQSAGTSPFDRIEPAGRPSNIRGMKKHERIAALLRMTMDRGCTAAEAETARRLAATLQRVPAETIARRFDPPVTMDLHRSPNRPQRRARANLSFTIVPGNCLSLRAGPSAVSRSFLPIRASAVVLPALLVVSQRWCIRIFDPDLMRRPARPANMRAPVFMSSGFTHERRRTTV